ncbi:hypothetical protein FGIG_08513 [Fasciola gigantica]|uniref:PIG-P domain-containing protein n=1 Tax=Fasciola gigantica TaxID=46835 RepID=A0A504YKC0_FASGI|nr:hypothetical protein FGIG_08513 [Fasciola gigantica]
MVRNMDELEDFDFQIQTPASHPGPQEERALYGFVMYISSFILFGIYLIFAFVPRDWLSMIGVTYLPHRHWAITFPIALTATGVGFLFCYTLCHFQLTQPLTSIYQIRDRLSVRPSNQTLSRASVIPPYLDYCSTMVNRELYLHPAQKLDLS